MKRLWIAFCLVMVLSFLVLGWIGTRIYQEMPPLPARVVTTQGTVLVDEGEIQAGQNVWQALGGMEVGSVWGHGSYVAPDWTADWLHRECMFILNEWSSKEFGKSYDQADNEKKALLEARLEKLMRQNTYDPVTGMLTLDPVRQRAFEDNHKHFSEIFKNGNEDYAIRKNAQPDPVKLRQLSAFFFWSSWA